MSPGQSQNRPLVEWAMSSRRAPFSKAASRSPNRCGAAYDIDRYPESTSSTSRTMSARPGAKIWRGVPNLVRASACLAVWLRRGEALTGPPFRAEVALDDRPNRVVRYGRQPGPDWLPSTVVGVHDERNAAPGFEDVVGGLGNRLAICPVERLPEGHQLERSEVQSRDVLGDRVHPSDVCDSVFVRASPTLSEHFWVGIERGGLVEMVGQFDREDTRPAADIEQAAGAMESALARENAAQLP